MKVFIAGGSGTIGIPLVRALVASGHQVSALTRSPGKQEELHALGATPVVANALDRDALVAAVRTAAPTHVIHQLTALPKGGVRSAKDIEATNRLRIDGTRNLLDAAIKSGVRRFIVGSFALLSPRGPEVEESENAAAAAVRSMERQVLDATARGSIEGVILRYGLFYGLETPSMVQMINMVRKRRLPVVRGDAGQLPLIHIDDAVRATLLALDRAPAGSVYEIVDDQAVSMSQIVEALAKSTGSPTPFRVPAWLPRLIAPYMARLASMRMPLSNAKAKAELAWLPRYSTMRDGLAEIFSQAA
jgi:nucleoside-diphosphate-sugar epimerase